MSDMMSILSSNYLTVGSTLSSGPAAKYVNVDPASYQGTWTGQYGNGTKFSVSISDVSGFKAKVKYQSGSTTNYGQVLINNSAFRIGDSKFVLTGTGKATVATVVTDPVSGTSTLNTAAATLG